MRRNWWQLKKRKDKARQNLTNNGDGSFTASFNLYGLLSNQTSWNFKVRIEDSARVRDQPTATISVNSTRRASSPSRGVFARGLTRSNEARRARRPTARQSTWS